MAQVVPIYCKSFQSISIYCICIASGIYSIIMYSGTSINGVSINGEPL